MTKKVEPKRCLSWMRRFIRNTKDCIREMRAGWILAGMIITIERYKRRWGNDKP